MNCTHPLGGKDAEGDPVCVTCGHSLVGSVPIGRRDRAITALRAAGVDVAAIFQGTHKLYRLRCGHLVAKKNGRGRAPRCPSC